MSRRNIGVSDSLHASMKQLSDDVGVPITIILQHWLECCSERDWDAVKRAHDSVKPTWANIKKSVEQYQATNPGITDGELVKLTGYSLAQVETITHTAHKRCLGYMSKHPKSKPERVSKECGVSVRFAQRIYEIKNNGAKAPKAEEYLYD